MFPSAKYVSSSKGVTIEKPTVTPTPRQSPKPKNSRPPSLPMQERITAQDSNPIKISFNNPRGDRRALKFILIHFLLYSKYGSETETVKHFKIGFDFHQHIFFYFSQKYQSQYSKSLWESGRNGSLMVVRTLLAPVCISSSLARLFSTGNLHYQRDPPEGASDHISFTTTNSYFDKMGIS